jgi:hypothetical protein
MTPAGRWTEGFRERSRLSFILATILTGGLALVALRALDLAEVSAAFGQADLLWVVPALGALAVAFVIRALRWQLLFDFRRRPPLREVSGALLAGLFFNSVLPFRAGEVARLLVLHRRARSPRLQVLGTIAAERIYDVLALLVLFALALPWLPEAPWLRSVAFAGAALVVAAVLASVARPLRFVSSVTDTRREEAGKNLLAGVVALHRVRPATTAAILTMLSWLVLWLSSWLLLQGFAFEVGFGAAATLLVLVATGFSLSLPSGPGAVGVFEAAVIVALLPFGVEPEAALSYGLVLHALNAVPYVVAGLLILPRLSR